MLELAKGYESGLWSSSASGGDRSKERAEEETKIAFDWLKKAADLGDSDALNAVGDCLQHGKGVDNKDYVAAIRHYLRAANSGSIDGIVNLGLCYLNGIGVERDIEEARVYFQRASGLGHADAHCFMGSTLLLLGDETQRDAAVQWLLKAAEKGSIRAMQQLGKCYLVHNTAQHNTTTQHSVTQYNNSTTQHNTTQRSTPQQHNTAQ